MYILGIESSCDETAAAVVKDGCHIQATVVASQVQVHHRYGGVVPELASRKHIEAGSRLEARRCEIAKSGELERSYEH